MYFLTLLIFIALLISPFLFFWPQSRSKASRKTILYAQIIFYLYWNIVFWSVLYGYLPYSFAVFGTGDPESSIFMVYWFFTPIVTLVLITEIIYFFRHKKAIGF